jgi:hypothetical protein
LKDERGLLFVNEEEERKICIYGQQEVGHGRATYWHGPCHLSDFIHHFFASKLGTAVPYLARAVPLLWSWGFKIFPFFSNQLGQLPTKTLKTKKNKTKAIKCVGCLPRSALLMSLA